MEEVGRGLRTFANLISACVQVSGEVQNMSCFEVEVHRVPLGTTSSSSCPPSRRFSAMTLLPSPFPAMRPAILPGARAVGRVTRRRVHGWWAAARAKGTGALERHQLILLALSRAATRAAHGPPRSILPRRASQQRARGNGGRQGDQKARSWAVCSSIEALLELEGLGEAWAAQASYARRQPEGELVNELESVYRH